MITFGDITIITAAEGVFVDPKLGIMPRVWNFKRLIRADGEIAFDRGRTGADHSFTVRFLDVTVANVGTIRDRIESLVAEPMEESLTLPDMPAIPNCVCTGVDPSAATRAVILSYGGGTLVQTATYNMEFALTFRQVRG